ATSCGKAGGYSSRERAASAGPASSRRRGGNPPDPLPVLIPVGGIRGRLVQILDPTPTHISHGRRRSVAAPGSHRQALPAPATSSCRGTPGSYLASQCMDDIIRKRDPDHGP